ncbi:GalNAc-alpha-(1-_4)-GalNAc-alpha-(1-_3)-diNAcBac-PP-undecaprenol alpha-1,4-N-acetyl-D-galactosaminyltransferase [Lachnospiraceae bacterium]|nr:GalNAc-alpha-(1->4)-GalNAc-alpha-(1->3)-diNAcBac-PP-undecaprenol alpha-1,4-N-acetyl-D-galactosaminyltransferase [Lachnospiraceae bacterium]
MIKKVLFVTRFMSGGGAERVISVLSSEMEKQGYEVGILVYNRTEKDYATAFGVKVLTLGEGYSENKGNSVTRKFYRRKQIRQVVKEYKPDVIIPFLKPIVVETYQFAASLGIPILATVRNVPQFSGKLDRMMYLYAVSHCKAVFLQTAQQKQNFNEKIHAKTFVVSNPVSEVFLETGAARNYELVQKPSKVIVSAGRLDKQKNQKLLIEAMALVHKKHDDWVLKLFGEGKEKRNLEACIRNHKAENYIFLCGRTNHLPEEFGKADLFVLSSDFEGMPNALLEAMAAGMPCVSTDCPTGPASLIGDNVYGRLSPVSDAILLADNIMYFIEKPEEAICCGEKAYHYIRDNYSPQKITEKLIENINRYIDS